MTISGGAERDATVRGFRAPGRCRSLLGSLKSVWISLATSECGVTARRFVGRLLRGSALVGMDSGPGSDIVRVLGRGEVMRPRGIGGVCASGRNWCLLL